MRTVYLSIENFGRGRLVVPHVEYWREGFYPVRVKRGNSATGGTEATEEERGGTGTGRSE